MGGGPKGPNRTELFSSPLQTAAMNGGQGGGRKGQNPIGLSSRPPVPLGAFHAVDADSAGPSPERLPDNRQTATLDPNASRPSDFSNHGAAVGGRDKPTKGVGPVLRTLGLAASPTNFLSDDEAAAFCERAAIREYDGGLPRAAAERLAWLDVIAARSAQPLAQAV